MGGYKLINADFSPAISLILWGLSTPPHHSLDFLEQSCSEAPEIQVSDGGGVSMSNLCS